MRRLAAFLIFLGALALGVLWLRGQDRVDPLERLSATRAAAPAEQLERSQEEAADAGSTGAGDADRAGPERRSAQTSYAAPRQPLPPPLAVAPENAVEVRFVDRDNGEGVAFAELVLSLRDWPSVPASASVVTDSEGRVQLDVTRNFRVAHFTSGLRIGAADPRYYGEGGLSDWIWLGLEGRRPGAVIVVECWMAPGPALRVIDAATGEPVADPWVGLECTDPRRPEGSAQIQEFKTPRATYIGKRTQPLARHGDARLLPALFLDLWSGESPAPAPGAARLRVGAPGYALREIDLAHDWESVWSLDPPGPEPFEVALEPESQVPLGIEDGGGDPYRGELELVDRTTWAVVGVWNGTDHLAVDEALIEALEQHGVAAAQAAAVAQPEPDPPLLLFERATARFFEPDMWQLEPPAEGSATRVLRISTGALRLEFSGPVPELWATRDGVQFQQPLRIGEDVGGALEFPDLHAGRWWIGAPGALPLVARFGDMNQHLKRWPIAKYWLRANTAEELAYLAGLAAIDVEQGERRTIDNAWEDVVERLAGRIEVEGVEPQDLTLYPTWLDQRVPIVYEAPRGGFGEGAIAVDAEGRFERAGAVLRPQAYLVTARVARGPESEPAVGLQGPEVLLDIVEFEPDASIRIAPAALELQLEPELANSRNTVTLKPRIGGRWAYWPSSAQPLQAGATLRLAPLPAGLFELQALDWSEPRTLRLRAGETRRLELHARGFRQAP